MHAITALIALALSLGAGAEPGDAPLPDDRVAINPNISIGSCANGATPLPVYPSMGARTYSGDFQGQLYATDFFGEWCTGYVPPEPQYCVIVTGGGGYSFEVIDGDGVDTILALQRESADYLYCDDDGGMSLLSRIDAWLEDGEYVLYVGTYSSGYGGRFTLQVGASNW